MRLIIIIIRRRRRRKRRRRRIYGMFMMSSWLNQGVDKPRKCVPEPTFITVRYYRKLLLLLMMTVMSTTYSYVFLKSKLIELD